MMSVGEVSRLTGISIRTLHYYDEIGLLRPNKVMDNGYRMYDDSDIERLQQILIFREMEFPLKKIMEILDSPDYDRNRALDKQIEYLTKKKEHLENVILFATGIKLLGVNYMDYSMLDAKKLDEYAENAKQKYGDTPEYREFMEKEKSRTKEDNALLAGQIMQIFVHLGQLKGKPPEDDEVQSVIAQLQKFITDNCYTCTDEMLLGLGKMYAGGGEFTENIDKAGGEGTGEYAFRAIECYLRRR